MSPVTLNDFRIVSQWSEPDWQGLITDLSTDRRYNQLIAQPHKVFIRLALLSPLIQGVGVICRVALSALKLISLYHFWCKKDGAYSITERLQDAGTDLLKVALAPLFYVGLELSAIYGIMRPLDGRKLYATMERAFYGQGFLTRGWQPLPELEALPPAFDMGNHPDIDLYT